MSKLTYRLAQHGASTVTKTHAFFPVLLEVASRVQDSLLYVVGAYRRVATNVHLFFLRRELTQAAAEMVDATSMYQSFREYENNEIAKLQRRRLELFQSVNEAAAVRSAQVERGLAEAKALGRKSIYDHK